MISHVTLNSSYNLTSILLNLDWKLECVRRSMKSIFITSWLQLGKRIYLTLFDAMYTSYVARSSMTRHKVTLASRILGFLVNHSNSSLLAHFMPKQDVVVSK
uniref:Putative ovule protein n=1 Tax=Solanum chacoense TaxID=4108 RepID=A0A0V0GRW7_SOLCH